ncbi:lactonase family protein [Roseomonas sp. NAR14]|uniref:Lactonase family protein n=1 Tax=Roseomonas acroporae TaxID=2937791 RepID=A0A9X1YC93_9PROT|nr:beta-propeller fold lactonase family protein [Roseomonas acroporae]MCK8786062.1 lactonase family protein [Roseomonas acroporae]
MQTIRPAIHRADTPPAADRATAAAPGAPPAAPPAAPPSVPPPLASRRGLLAAACLLPQPLLSLPARAGAPASPAPAAGPMGIADRRDAVAAPGRVTFYVAVGPRLAAYEPDPAALTLAPLAGAEAVLPAAIQYVWPHPTLPLLYVAYSDRAGDAFGEVHGVQAVRMDAAGAPTLAGPPLRLDNRPIHLTLDGAGQHLFVAFNAPSELRVFRLGEDGAIGAPVAQRETPDGGIYAHQVRVSPDGRTVILVTRGNDARPGRPEDPGALKVFDLEAGQLRLRRAVAPGGGYGFGPRHLEFGPGQAFLYVSLERENRLDTFAMGADGPATLPAFSTGTLGGPARAGLRQLAGAIHLSPRGDVVYVANRADSRERTEAGPAFAGGENTMAVFRIDPASGEPRLVQTIETERFHPRCFSLHPDGGMLVTAAIKPMPVRDGGRIRTVPAGLTVFGVGPDGLLRRHAHLDLATPDGDVFWCGMVRRPG